MTDYGRLRFVIQIAGIYLLVQSITSALSAVSKYVGYQMLAGYPADMRLVKGETLWTVGYALLILLVAWVPLARTDACARTITYMSGRTTGIEPSDEQAS